MALKENEFDFSYEAIEASKKDPRVDTTGMNYTEKKSIFDKLKHLDNLDQIANELEKRVGDNYPSVDFHVARAMYDAERQGLLREAVSLNMHLDTQAIHIREPWNGKSEKYKTTSFKEYIGGLLEQYANK